MFFPNLGAAFIHVFLSCLMTLAVKKLTISKINEAF